MIIVENKSVPATIYVPKNLSEKYDTYVLSLTDRATNKTYAFEAGQEIEYAYYFWSFDGTLRYSDEFKDPVDIGNWIDIIDIEASYGVPYSYGHVWNNVSLSGLNSYRLVLE